MLKSSQALETMDSGDNNVYTSNKLDKYENSADNLEQLGVADFTSVYDYVGKFEEE